MITWWLGSLILIVFFIIIGVFISSKFDYDVYACKGGLTFFILFIGFAISLLYFGLKSWSSPIDDNIKYTYENKLNVYSIEDNINTSGIFILGCGSVDSNLYYYVMIGNDQEGYTISKYNVENTYLVPEDKIQPYIIEKHKHYNRIYTPNILFGGLFKPLEPDLKQNEIVKTELHLPKNYIKQNYNIDMK